MTSTQATTGAASAQSHAGYAHPETLVDTQWVADHLNDPHVRIVEADEDPLLYEIGHIQNAVKLDWHVDVQDPVRRDFVDKAAFEALMSRYGITPETTVVLYGDKSNWYAAYSFWLFRMYGHRDLRIMNGGRTKWEAEGRPYVKDASSFGATQYAAQEPDLKLRAFRRQVEDALEAKQGALVDVRSVDEFTGKLLHMINYPQEGAQRGGHIPSAKSIPWSTAANPDGTFKSVEELTAIYGGKGVTADKPVITYCRIGERSAHTWFVLTQLLDYPNVRNYDGSWTEWGNLVGAPIEQGEER
ncbi:MAG TPA: sulfurtransferase [Ktedonobacterales bacterium]|jgi:thiosulfate/3-mercaptopyruvate sulfurtransferase|nr:sulfurtransferase [Ktedonobacterales bacterium]